MHKLLLMKKHLSIFILFLGIIISGQAGSNRFSDAENEEHSSNVYEKESGTSASAPDMAEAAGPPGGDDLPIDDYIPLLLVIAAGLIAYKTYGRKSLS